MNKKLHLLAALGLLSLGNLNAQTVISQTGGAIPTEGSIYCPLNNQAGQLVGMRESSYYRAYTMTSNTKIVSVKLGVFAVDLAASVPDFPITVKLYKSNGAFPASYPSGLTQLDTANATLTAANDESLVTVNFTNPVTVSSGDIIVAEIYNNNVQGGIYYIGAVSGNETAAGYIMATGCGVNTPQTVASLGVTGANVKIAIDLVENSSASSEDFFKENFTIYPNPATDVLNITSKNGLSANEIRISDLTGKVVKVQKDVSVINVSDLSTGTYLIDITTNEGKATSKFIKK